MQLLIHTTVYELHVLLKHTQPIHLAMFLNITKQGLYMLLLHYVAMQHAYTHYR